MNVYLFAVCYIVIGAVVGSLVAAFIVQDPADDSEVTFAIVTLGALWPLALCMVLTLGLGRLAIGLTRRVYRWTR